MARCSSVKPYSAAMSGASELIEPRMSQFVIGCAARSACIVTDISSSVSVE